MIKCQRFKAKISYIAFTEYHLPMNRNWTIMNFLTALMKEDEDGIYVLLANLLARGHCF